MLLLDTSVLVKWGNPSESETVVPYLQAHSDERFVTSSLVVFEFFRPAKRRANSQQVHAWLSQAVDDIEPFSTSAAETAATVESSLAQHDTALAIRDLLVVSHARDLDATFVTCDRNDFENQVVRQLLDIDVVG